MINHKMKGYRTERKIRLALEKNNWRVIRAGGSIGDADLICVKDGKCIFMQVKSTKNKTFYYYGYMGKKLEGIPFYLVVDFGGGRVRMLHPKKKINLNDGMSLEDYIERNQINLRL